MLSGKNHCQGYFEVVNDPTSTSIEREYELISQFNLTQKDHSKQPKENTSEVLKGFFIVGKKMSKVESLAPKLNLRRGLRFSQKYDCILHENIKFTLNLLALIQLKANQRQYE